MDSVWEAVKMACSGIFNWGTLIGLVVGVVVYGSGSLIVTCFENREYTMRLFALLQLWLGSIRNKQTKRIAGWLWTEIMSLDYERRCQLAIESSDEEYRIWLILQLPYLGHKKKRIARTCRVIASTPGISEKITKAAQICVEKIEGQE